MLNQIDHILNTVCLRKQQLFKRRKYETSNIAILRLSSVSDESSYGNAPPPPYHYAMAAMKYPSIPSVVSRSELQAAVEHLQQRMQRVQQKGGGAEPRQPKYVLRGLSLILS